MIAKLLELPLFVAIALTSAVRQANYRQIQTKSVNARSLQKNRRNRRKLIRRENGCGRNEREKREIKRRDETTAGMNSKVRRGAVKRNVARFDVKNLIFYVDSYEECIRSEAVYSAALAERERAS